MDTPYLVLATDPHLWWKEPYGPERAEFKWRILEYIVKHTIQSDAIGLTLLGDLFKFPNAPEHLRERFWKTINPLFTYKKYFIYLGGNHDSTAVSSCFSGEQYLNSPYVKIFTGTEVKPLGLPGFENFIMLPWYASLNEDWHVPYEDKIVLAHIGVQGAFMNNTRESEDGISVSLLKKKKFKVFSGHFHKAQDTEHYVYVGALFRENFGEIEYETCISELSAAGTFRRIPIEDWVFLDIETDLTGDKYNFSQYEISAPCAIRFRATVNTKKLNHLLVDTQIKAELKKKGVLNIVYLKKEITVNKKKVENSIRINQTLDVKQDILSFAKENNFSEVHLQLGEKWL
jgi:DNA repair exonuclease SbcCD nuclease subunit